MAALATQSIVNAGLGPTYAAAAGGGDTLTPDSDTFLHVKNGGGAPITVTITIPAKLRGKTVTNETISVPNGGERMIGPFPADVYADPTTGQCGVGYSGVTTVTVGVFKVGQY